MVRKRIRRVLCLTFLILLAAGSVSPLLPELYAKRARSTESPADEQRRQAASFAARAEAIDVSVDAYQSASVEERQALAKAMMDIVDWYKSTAKMSFDDVEKGVRQGAEGFAPEQRREYGSAYTAFCLSLGLGGNKTDRGKTDDPLMTIQCTVNELTGHGIEFTISRVRALITLAEAQGDLPAGQWRAAKTAYLMRAAVARYRADRDDPNVGVTVDKFDSFKAGAFFEVFCEVTGLEYAKLYPQYLQSLPRPLTVYTERDFGGQPFFFSEGECGLVNKPVKEKIASLKVMEGYRVIFYAEDAREKKAVKEFTGEVSAVDDSLRRQFYSLAVEKIQP